MPRPASATVPPGANRRRRQTSTPDAGAGAGAAIQLTPPAPRDDAAAGDDEQLEQLLAEFGGAAGFRVRVERKDARGGADYLGTLELTTDLLDDVRAAWGGGKYRGRVVDTNGAYVRSIQFGIAGAPRDPEPATPAPSAHAIAPRVDVVPDRLERLERLVEGLATTLAAVKQPDRLEEFRLFAGLMRETAPVAVPVAAPVDPLTTMTALLEFQNKLEERNGGRDRGGNGFDVATLVKEGVRPLVEVMDKKIELEREAMLRRRPPVAIAPAPGAPAAIAAAPGTLEHLAGMLPPFARNFLASCARDDKSAELYAETVLDNLPGNIVDELPAMLSAPDAAARLCAIVPEWRPYGEWFAELVAAILSSLAEDAGDDARESATA